MTGTRHRVSVLTTALCFATWCTVCGLADEPQRSTPEQNEACVLVAYDSLSGNTEKMAKTVAAAAGEVPLSRWC